MAAGRKKKPKAPSPKRKRSLSAKKGWETRRANELKRARAAKRAAKKAAATRARKRTQKLKRAAAARRGWATKRARALLESAVGDLRDAVIEVKRASDAGELEEGESEGYIAPLRESMHEAKSGLWEAVDHNWEDYVDLIDDIAFETDVDWNLSYGPGEE